MLPVPGVELGLTYSDIRVLAVLPTSEAVVGGADTGCQSASIGQSPPLMSGESSLQRWKYSRSS